jgi:hypothetical protein
MGMGWGGRGAIAGAPRKTQAETETDGTKSGVSVEA